MRTTALFSRSRLFGLALIGVLAVTACARDQVSQPRPGPSNPAFNQADVQFMQQMVLHHSQAIEMAKLVGDRSDRPELEQLAEKIITTQAEEIGTMKGLLAEAGVEPPDEGMSQGGTQMPGMASQADLDQLRGLDGQQFDLLFIDLMTEHHKGALSMAQEESQQGKNSEVTNLAQQIVKAQQTEIDQMATWKQRWSG